LITRSAFFMMNSTDEGYSTEAPSDDLSAVWTAIIVLILIVTLIFVRFLCCGNCSVGDSPPDDEFYVMSVNERISPEQQRRYLERRRTLIMKSIVQKVRDVENTTGEKNLCDL